MSDVRDVFWSAASVFSIFLDTFKGRKETKTKVLHLKKVTKYAKI